MHHNMDKLSRIYPAGSRTDSSNYNPVPMWNVGCQIGTVHARILQGSEASNVGFHPLCPSAFPPSGPQLPDSLQRNADQPGPLPAKRLWRLHPQTRIYEKPVLPVRSQQADQGALAQEDDFSRHGEMNPSPPFGVSSQHLLLPPLISCARLAGESTPTPTIFDKRVSTQQVISAQQLPKLNKDKQKSIVDPLVRVELYGVPADNASKETHHISNNGERTHRPIQTCYTGDFLVFNTHTCLQDLTPCGTRDSSLTFTCLSW